METGRPGILPNDAVSVGVLVVAAMSPLTVEGILRALAHIGAPSWRPVGDVVVGVVMKLREHGLLNIAAPETQEGDKLAPTAWGRTVLPELLYALPMSGTALDVGYKLKVMGLDVLDAASRERQLRALLDHWRDVATMWQDAEDRCPCRERSVRGWMQHNINLARSEIEWLTSAKS